MWSITVIYYWKIWFLKWAGRHKTIIYSCKTELELALYTCSSSEKTMEECAPVICLLLLSVSFLFKQLSSIWTKQNDHSAFNNRTKTQSKILNSFFLILPHVISIFCKLNETTKEAPSNCYIFLYHGWVFIYFSKYR